MNHEITGLKALIMSDTLHLLDAELAEQASWPREPVTAFRELTGDPRGESTGGAPAGVSGGEGGGEGGAAGAGGEGVAGGEGGEGGSGGVPDFMEAFESFRSDITGQIDGLSSRIPEPAREETPPPPARPDVFDPRNFSDDDFDEHGELTREAQQRALNELVDQRVAEALSPIQQDRAQERRDIAANALEERYPDLTNPEVFEPALERAQAMAQHMARSTGDRSWVNAWQEPAFFEMAYLAGVGRNAAAGETPAGRQGGVTLEQGGSAGPGGAGADDGGKAVADGIARLAQKSKFRLGSS